MAVKKKNENPLPIPAVIDSADGALKAFRESAALFADHPELVEQARVSYVGNPISVETVKSVDQWVTDQLQGAANAGDKWLRGIKAPSRDPKAAAKAAETKWAARTTQAIQEKRFGKGIDGYNLDDAIATAEKVGGAGYAAGVANREAKIRAKVSKLQPLVVAAKRTLDAMPSDTDAQAEAKAVAAIKLMREIGKTMRG